jgi:hypothetical protein
MASDEHVIDDTQLSDEFHILEGSYKSLADDVMYRLCRQVHDLIAMPLESEISLIRFVELSDAVEHSGLPCSIGTDKSIYFFVFDIKSEIIHCLEASECDG